MKKIEIRNEQEIINVLKSGRMVEGRLALITTEDNRKAIEFVAYNRSNKRRPQDRTVATLEHGWVKESAERIKVYESVPKKLGTVRVCSVLQREIKEAQNILQMEEILK
jgi:hypothetical protein